MTRGPSARSSRLLFAAFAAAALGLAALEAFLAHGLRPLEHRLLDAFVRWHAVACALDMADELLAFRDELGEAGKSFDVGIGLHSGPAVVGLIGSARRREYTSIGDTVNLASRIEGLAEDAGRRILVSRETTERCAGAFDFVSCGTYPLKRPRPAGGTVRAAQQTVKRLAALSLLAPALDAHAAQSQLAERFAGAAAS